MKTRLIAALISATCLCAVVIVSNGAGEKVVLRGRLTADLLPSPGEAAAQEAHLNYPSLKSLGISLKRTTPEDYAALAPQPKIMARRGLQCAQYARVRSGLSIMGNARTWWQLAAGKYKRDNRPLPGAVMVMGGTRHGHVAVVTEVRSSREVLIDHANWLNRGEIQMGALVRDVSLTNDWSRVRVWYPPINDLGSRAYPVYGFILNQRETPEAQPQVIPAAMVKDAGYIQPRSM